MNALKTAAAYRAVATGLTMPSKAFIDGEWHAAASGRVFENLDPATGAGLGLVAHCDAVDVDRAVAAARRSFSESNLKPVNQETGGKSPFIVLDDADIDDTLASSAVSAAFWNGGQNCSVNMRQIVDVNVKDAFLDRVLEMARALRIGDPLDPDTDLGSMVSIEHQALVLSYIEAGKQEGARLLTGGSASAGLAGSFIDPTVFDGVVPTMCVAREEIFGPVLGVISVKGMDEALKAARDTDYGLHATIFTRDIDKVFHLAKRLPCGTVAINGFTEDNVTTPFGGYKRSGSLARDNGTEAVDQCLQTKTIWVSLR